MTCFAFGFLASPRFSLGTALQPTWCISKSAAVIWDKDMSWDRFRNWQYTCDCDPMGERDKKMIESARTNGKAWVSLTPANRHSVAKAPFHAARSLSSSSDGQAVLIGSCRRLEQVRAASCPPFVNRDKSPCHAVEEPPIIAR